MRHGDVIRMHPIHRKMGTAPRRPGTIREAVRQRVREGLHRAMVTARMLWRGERPARVVRIEDVMRESRRRRAERAFDRMERVVREGAVDGESMATKGERCDLT